jgi:hypothetical protein
LRASKNIPFIRIEILSLAVIILFSGCLELSPEPVVITDWIDNALVIQVTVKNNTSTAKSVALLPALGHKKISAYQWATGIEANNFYTENLISIDAGSERVLETFIVSTAYDGFQIGDVIMSFLLHIDGSMYAGWDKQYGTGNKTLVSQGYGYAVLGENNGNPGWHSPNCPPKKEWTNTTDNPTYNSDCITARYIITITNNKVEFVLNELIIASSELSLFYPSNEN